MDIIFQSGEFYSNSLPNFWSTFGGHIVTLLGVVITGFFGVYLFNIGVKKERRLNKEFREKEKQDLKERELQELEFFKKHFITLTEGVIEGSLKQKKDYEEYATNVLENPKQQQLPIQRTHENLTRLLKIDTQKIQKLFDENKADNNLFIKFLNNIDYLNEVFKKISEDIYGYNGETFIDLSNKLIGIRNKILSNASEFIENEKFNNLKYLENPLWVTINELVLDYHTDYNGIPSVEWDYDKLITQIKNKLLKDEYRNFAISNTLLNLSKEGGDIVFSIVELNNNLADDILRTSKYIGNVCESIKVIKTKIITSK